MSDATSWYLPASTTGNAHHTLFCFPHAGGSFSTYRRWQDGLGPDIDVAPAILPGREGRIAEPSVTSITGLAEALTDPTRRRAPGSFALFGHSMGALVAFELARRLAALGRPPELLIVSGSQPPQSFPNGLQYSGLEDAEFLDSVSALGAVPDGLFDIAELRDLLLPVLRADYLACETYHLQQQPLLDIPMLIVGGDQDPRVSVEDLESWRELTSKPSSMHILNGGHFFLIDQLPPLLKIIRAALDQLSVRTS